jgi:hypothetical protein
MQSKKMTFEDGTVNGQLTQAGHQGYKFPQDKWLNVS